jgi:hypothetical protein
VSESEIKMFEDVIAKLKEAHGPDLRMLTSASGPIVLRPPKASEFSRFIDEVANEKKSRATAMRSLALACAVYPAGDLVLAAFEKQPGLPLKAVDAISEMAGAGDDSSKL